MKVIVLGPVDKILKKFLNFSIASINLCKKGKTNGNRKYTIHKKNFRFK